MTEWTYTFHRFDSEAAFESACKAAKIVRDKEGTLLVPSGTALDVIGAYFTGGEVDEKGEVVKAAVAVPGFHVNAAWMDPVPKSFAVASIQPATPSRVFA